MPAQQAAFTGHGRSPDEETLVGGWRLSEALFGWSSLVRGRGAHCAARLIRDARLRVRRQAKREARRRTGLRVDAQVEALEHVRGNVRWQEIDWSFCCYRCGGMASAHACPHESAELLQVSGTQLRKSLGRTARGPEFGRPEVLQILREHYAAAAAKSQPPLLGFARGFWGIAALHSAPLSDHKYLRLHSARA